MQYIGERNPPKNPGSTGNWTEDILIASQMLIPPGHQTPVQRSGSFATLAAQSRSPSWIQLLLSLSRVYLDLPKSWDSPRMGLRAMLAACTSILPEEIILPSTTQAFGTITPYWPWMPMALCIITPIQLDTNANAFSKAHSNEFLAGVLLRIHCTGVRWPSVMSIWLKIRRSWVRIPAESRKFLWISFSLHSIVLVASLLRIHYFVPCNSSFSWLSYQVLASFPY